MVVVELGNIGTEKQAQRIKSVLQNKTFYNFQVQWGTYAGNYPVSVCTDYKRNSDFGSLEELQEYERDVKDMILFVLASEI